MGKVTDTIFKPVKFEFGQVHIAGGHTATPASAKSKSVEGSDKKQHLFVKMATSEKWLLHAVCGSGDKSRYSFSRTSLMNELRDQIVRLADGTVALDATPVVAPEEYDPMSEIGSAPATDSAGVSAFLSADKRGRARYYKNRAKNCIVTVNVASRCPEVDPHCTQMRAVKLFIVDRLTIWLSIDDVAWAVRYLFEQHHLKGVPLVADDDAGPGGGVAGSVPVGP
jgi:hypothetical protein